MIWFYISKSHIEQMKIQRFIIYLLYFLDKTCLKKLNVSLLKVSHSVDDNLGQTVPISSSSCSLASQIVYSPTTTSTANHSSHNYFNNPYKVYKISETKMNIYTGMKTRAEDDVSLCSKLYILKEFLYCAQINYLLQRRTIFPGLAYIGLTKGYENFCLLQAKHDFQTPLKATH